MITKAAAIVIKNKRVLYLRKKDFLFYILPGGRIELGETPEQALKREMGEELSTDIEIKGFLGNITGCGFNQTLDELTPVSLDLYLVNLCNEPSLSGEIHDKSWVTYKNLHNFLMTPIGIETVKFLHKKGLID